MDEGELRYLTRRVDEELARAQQASDPRVVAAHYGLSCIYLDRLELLASTAGATRQ